MTVAPAITEDFEFAALEAAVNYRNAIVDLFRAQLKGRVVELGAGVGQMSQLFSALPEVSDFLAVEPDEAYCERIRAEVPLARVHHGFLADLDNATDASDAIVSVNVFEHIEDDRAEFAKCCALLKSRQGALCLLVPARPELYSKIDRDFKHFRRYTRPELKKKLTGAGFKIERLSYFNLVGYFAWLINFRLLGARRFEKKNVQLFDRHIFPRAYGLEKTFGAPPFGQSLIAVARA